MCSGIGDFTHMAQRCRVWKYRGEEAFVLLCDRPCTIKLTGVRVDDESVGRALGRATPSSPMDAVIREMGVWDSASYSFRGGVLGLME